MIQVYPEGLKGELLLYFGSAESWFFNTYSWQLQGTCKLEFQFNEYL